jgi:type I restriction enzyme S subunit
MNNWKNIKISEFATTQSGGTPSTSRDDFWNGDVPWINSGELKDCRISKASKYITKLGLESSSARLFPKGTVVIALTGATTAKLGLLEIETSTNQSVTGIIPNNNYDPFFLFYQLLSLRREILSKSLGTAQPHINKRIVDEIIVKLPPLPEQQAIVAKIEELFSELENGKQQLLTAQQQLKVYRQSLLKWAFEGKLTNKDLKEGELPKGWKWVKLKEVASDISDGDHQAPPKSETGVPFITISNVNKTTSKIDFTDTFKVNIDYYKNLKANRKPKIGDVLYTVTGSFGIPVLIDFDKEFCFQRHIGLVRPLPEINQKWVYFLLQSPKVFSQAKKTATGTAQKTVALSSLRNFDIPFCSRNEQQFIVSELESKLTVCDKIEETISQSLQQAETLRQSILKKAFEGKLV